MKILELRAENFKRLSAVELRVADDETLIEISGRNGQGKSSVLDAIWATLGGKDGAADAPVKEGAPGAEVTVKFGDDSKKYVARRTWDHAGGSRITLYEEHEGKVGRPQQILDTLLARIALDPSHFLSMNDKKQVETVRLAVGLDTSEIDKAIERAFEDRRVEKRVLDQAKKVWENAKEKAPEVMPMETGNLKELRAEENRLNKAVMNMKALHQEILKTEKRLGELETELTKMQAEHGSVSLSEGKLADLEAEIKAAQEFEDQTASWNRYMDAASDYKNAGEKVTALEKALHDSRERRRVAIAGAALPVPELAFNELGDALLYNGIPFSQASSSEKLRAAMGLAIAQNPELRVIHLRDGSLFDTDSLFTVAEVAAEHDFQVWVEKVDETGQVGIVIEDGTIIADNR